VHRDIKPENIFILEGGPPHRGKLLDFGIARRITGQIGDGLTQVGAVLGTPYYMSPQQMQGAPLDHRADLWSVGAVMFRALSGRLPFESRHFTALLAEMSTKGAVPLGTYRPDLPASLIALVDRALAIDPGARFGTAEEMRDALMPFRRGERGRPSAVPPPQVTLGEALPTGDASAADTASPLARSSAKPARSEAGPAGPSRGGEDGRVVVRRSEPAPSSRPAVERATPPSLEWQRELSKIEGEIEELRRRQGLAQEDEISTDESEQPGGPRRPWLRRWFGEGKD
jgi:serine/threonine-protein kinase